MSDRNIDDMDESHWNLGCSREEPLHCVIKPFNAWSRLDEATAKHPTRVDDSQIEVELLGEVPCEAFRFCLGNRVG